MPFVAESKQALSAIKKAGLLLTFTQMVDVYNTTTQRVQHTPTIYQMWCLVTKSDHGKTESYDEDGSTVDYQQGLLAAAYGVAVVPRIGDTVVLFGNKWTVIEKTSTFPDGTPIIYKLNVRRG